MAGTMRALHLCAGKLHLERRRPRPAARAGEVRVRVLLAGICATDLALRRGYMGFCGVPGHEFVGIALEGPLAGRRVVGEINASCGACSTCARCSARHCPQRTVLGILGRDGAFAEELSLPAANLHAVPASVGNRQALFSEPLAAAFEIAEQVELRADQRALVAGDGKLGLLCAHVLALHGLEVTVAGHHPERALLLPAGARHAGSLEDLRERGAQPFALAVEATGSPAGLAAVLAHLEPRGTLVLKTTCERPADLDLAGVVVNELTLVGSRCGPFEPALQALERGGIPLEGWIAATYPLEEAEAAMEHAARPGTLKVLIEP